MYAPPWLVINASQSDREQNYAHLVQTHKLANALMEQLLQDELNTADVNAAKNALVNTLRANQGISGCDRFISILSTFYNALLALAGAVLAVVAISMPFVGATIPLAALGLFAAGYCGTRAVYYGKHANDRGRKTTAEFSDVVENLVDGVTKTSK